MRKALVVVGLAALAGCTRGRRTADAGPAPQPGASEVPAPIDERHGTPSSCNMAAKVGYCLDFDADAPKDQAKTNCNSANNGPLPMGAILDENDGCPTEGRVGTCVAVLAKVKMTYRYYGPRYTTATAQKNCKDMSGTAVGGVFTPD